MINIWKMVYNLLTADVELTTALGHSVEEPRIFRGQQYKLIKNKNHMILFTMDESQAIEATQSIRDVDIHLSVISRISDVDSDNLSEILIRNLDGKIITDDNLNVHGVIYWDNYKTAPVWDEDDKLWLQDLRFRVTVSEK